MAICLTTILHSLESLIYVTQILVFLCTTSHAAQCDVDSYISTHAVPYYA